MIPLFDESAVYREGTLQRSDVVAVDPNTGASHGVNQQNLPWRWLHSVLYDQATIATCAPRRKVINRDTMPARLGRPTYLDLDGSEGRTRTTNFSNSSDLRWDSRRFPRYGALLAAGTCRVKMTDEASGRFDRATALWRSRANVQL